MSNLTTDIILNSTGENPSSVQDESPDNEIQTNNEVNVSPTENNTENVSKPQEKEIAVETNPQRIKEKSPYRDNLDASREISPNNKSINKVSLVDNTSDEVDKRKNGSDVLKNFPEEKKDISSDEIPSSSQIQDENLNPVHADENRKEQSGQGLNTESIEVEEENIENKEDEKRVEINNECSVDEEAAAIEKPNNETQENEFVLTNDSDISLSGEIVIEREVAKSNKNVEQLVNKPILSDQSDNYLVRQEKEIDTSTSKVINSKTNETLGLEKSISSVNNEAKDDIIDSDEKGLDIQTQETTLKIERKTSDVELDDSSKISNCIENEKPVSEELTSNFNKDDPMEVDELDSQSPKTEVKGLEHINKQEKIGEHGTNVQPEIPKNSTSTESEKITEMEIDEIIENDKCQTEKPEESTKVETDEVTKNDTSSQPAKQEEPTKIITEESQRNKQEELTKVNTVEIRASKQEELTKLDTDEVTENDKSNQSAKLGELTKVDTGREVIKKDKNNQLSTMEVKEVSQDQKSCNDTSNKPNKNTDKIENQNKSSDFSSSDDSGDELLYSNNFKELLQSCADKEEMLRKKYFPDNKVKLDDTEVICLEDDDDDDVKIMEKPAAAVKCINPNCMSGENLAKPALFVLNHFKLKRSKGQQVCEECFISVAEHVSSLGNLLMNKEPLMKADFPNYRDVILLDSDEERDSDDESYLSDETMSMIRDNIDDVIAECMDKVDFNHQIRESSVILNSKFDRLQDDAKDLNVRFNAVQDKLDEFRRDIYKHFTQPIQELDEVNLSDCEIPPMPLLSDRVKLKQYNQQLIQSLKKNEQQHRELEDKARQQAYAQRNAANKASVGYETIQEVVALQSNTRCEPPPNLPPPGPLLRPKLKVGEVVYTMKVSYFSVWVLVKVLEVIPRIATEVEAIEEDVCIILPPSSEPATETYRVRFDQGKKVKTVTGKYLAYARPANVMLRVGTRVIAIFKDEESELNSKPNYYVGVIAEPPKSTNKYRYLVFFDDGYTQYCPHESVLVVVESSPSVWEDIHPEPRDFIKNYLAQYPERPMVKLNKGQVVKVEWNGKWWIVKVLEVDGSLVKVHFNADNRTEWIYRGSTRLGPMYQELAAAKERQSGIRPTATASNKANKTLPYVEYTRGDTEEKKEEDKEATAGSQEASESVPVRSVARKSTAKKPPEPIVTNVPYTKPLVSQIPQGRVTQRLFKKALRPLDFRPHQCNRSCVSWTDYSPDVAKKYDPLVKPIMFGFERLAMNYRGRSVIFYRGPCGRMIRNHQEMIVYLGGTKSLLTIDMFDFDFWVNIASEFKEATTFCRIEDLSYGKENVPISCVNELDHGMPQYVEYLTARNPTKGVNLNLDPEFLVGCECKDDCSDRDSCSCWKMTMQGKAYLPDGDLDPVFGYQFRRLSERVATGIYECNSKCGCSSTCQNRVAQQPLSCRLQLFKTLKKGWGIRCLHDIPRGTFICIYAGFLLTDQEANEGGKTYGDEYLAELDYIESVEGLKQGYESEAREMSDLEEEEDDADDNSKKREMKDEEFSQGSQVSGSSGDDNSNDAEDNKPPRGDIRLRLRRRNLEESEKEPKKPKDEDAISISDDEAETNGYYYTVLPINDQASRKPQTFDANITKAENDEEDEYPSVRDLYGPDERVFIMDAKTHGNIGRYLNHSCSPNVFVQNVFVDTHDLRFPWVAFFASQYIPAGQELTWDYNYDVGSVPGKVMHCYCGSPNCRGRLL